MAKKNMKYKILDFRDDERIDNICGVHVKLLAMIYCLERQFIVYEDIKCRIQYIEEKISTQISDTILGEDKVVYIEDDNLWRKLLQICHKEGIL